MRSLGGGDRASPTPRKLLAYDAFLCGWSLAHPRFRTQGARPAVVFVCPNPHAALACAREADDTLTGRIGVMGTPAEHWYFAGRDHMFFAVENDIHRGEPRALALPALPPGLRERLGRTPISSSLVSRYCRRKSSLDTTTSPDLTPQTRTETSNRPGLTGLRSHATTHGASTRSPKRWPIAPPRLPGAGEDRRQSKTEER